MLFLVIDSLCAMSAQVTWGTWFGLVIGILLFRVLLGFGSTWDGPDLDLEFIMGDCNTQRQGGTHSDHGRVARLKADVSPEQKECPQGRGEKPPAPEDSQAGAQKNGRHREPRTPCWRQRQQTSSGDGKREVRDEHAHYVSASRAAEKTGRESVRGRGIAESRRKPREGRRPHLASAAAKRRGGESRRLAKPTPLLRGTAVRRVLPTRRSHRTKKKAEWATTGQEATAVDNDTL